MILYETNLAVTNYILPILSFLAVFFGIYTIVTKNPILSVLFLIGLFFSISLYLITIGLQFLGLVYLIVYVGAVSILFLFILMLINVRVSELLSDNRNSVSLAILTILCLNYTINDILPYTSYLHNTLDTYNVKAFYNYLSNIMSIQLLNSTSDILTSIYYYLLYVNVINISSKTWDAIIITASHITSIGNILYTNLLVLFIITSLILLLAMVGAIIITISKSKTNDEWSLTSPPKPHAFVNLPLQSKLSFEQLMLTFAVGMTVTLGFKSIFLLLITLCLKNGYMLLGKAITVFVSGILSFIIIRNFNKLSVSVKDAILAGLISFCILIVILLAQKYASITIEYIDVEDITLAISSGIFGKAYMDAPTGYKHPIFMLSQNQNPNGGSNGLPNGGSNGLPNGGSNGLPNGGSNDLPNDLPNDGPNGEPNDGPNGELNGGPNGESILSHSNNTDVNGSDNTQGDLSSDEDKCGCSHSGQDSNVSECNHHNIQDLPSSSVGGLNCCGCGGDNPDKSCHVDSCSCVFHDRCL